jgi:SAM-dependent methyltransferase
MVVAVLAVGWPRSAQAKGPRRRPLSDVAHFNHYAGRPIPSSPDPHDWEPDLLAIYQRARVLNGLRHNKPRAWEERALLRALERFVPPADPDGASTWLDVLPCTGILTARMGRERSGYAFEVLERTAEVARFVAGRLTGDVPTHLWPGAEGAGPTDGSFDQITCLFRLEGMPPAERGELLSAMARWLKPGGRLLLGFVSSRSFHGSLESVRRRGSGPGGVEYVLSPDPNIGPFEALAPRAVHDLVRAAGLRVKQRLGLQALPQPEELDFRTRNFRPLTQTLARTLGKACLGIESIPGVQSAWGRFQFMELTR